MEITPSGWYIQHERTCGNCAPDGNSILYDIFSNLGINYSEDIKINFQVLWHRYCSGDLTAKQVEKILIRLAEGLETGNPVDVWDYSNS